MGKLVHGMETWEVIQFAKKELCSLHKCFGHSSFEKLNNVVICETGTSSSQIYKMLQQIQRNFKYDENMEESLKYSHYGGTPSN